MRAFFIVLIVVWLVLLPPFFTGGICTDEFEQASAKFEVNRYALRSPRLAAAFLEKNALPFRVKPHGSGTVVYAEVPVKDRICSLYRDSSTKVQLQYDERDRLVRIISDMAPYRSLPLPWGGYLHWAR